MTRIMCVRLGDGPGAIPSDRDGPPRRAPGGGGPARASAASQASSHWAVKVAVPRTRHGRRRRDTPASSQ